MRRVQPSIRKNGDNWLAILKEEDGPLLLEILMDEMSCTYMASALSKKELPMTTSHMALEFCMNCLQANIEQVAVYALTDGYFRARMTIRDQREDSTYAVEVNVIDAIILAVIAACPILVAEEVFKQSNEETERTGRDYWTSRAQQAFNSMASGSGTKM